MVGVPLRALLQTPGVPGPFAATLIGRIPVTAIGLILVLHVENLTGSFATAGLSAACFSLGLAVSAPVIGRLIDRRGQARVLAPCAVAATLALAAIALLPADAPTAAIGALAAATGLSNPPLGSCLRALWMRTIDVDSRHAAFAIDSAATETTYVIGPVVLAGAIGGLSTRAALLTAAALVAIGAAAYVSRPAVRAWRSEGGHPSLLGPLSSGAVRSLLGCLVLTGTAFGSVEVGIAAVAEHAGRESLAGPLLGVWGTGSIVGALIVARQPPAADPAGRIAVLMAGVAAGHAPLVLGADPWVLAPLALVAGISIAPALTTIFLLLGAVAPAGTVTEAFTWATTGLTTGIATGAAVAGAVAGVGLGAPFAVAAVVTVLAAVLATLRRPVMRLATPQATGAEPW